MKGLIQMESLTISWWQLIVIFLGIFGYFFVSILTHERRITALETQVPMILQGISEIKTSIKDVDNKITAHIEKS